MVTQWYVTDNNLVSVITTDKELALKVARLKAQEQGAMDIRELWVGLGYYKPFATLPSVILGEFSKEDEKRIAKLVYGEN